MTLADQVKRFMRRLTSPRSLPRHQLSDAHKKEITEAIRKQRFYGDMPGRRQYDD